MQKYAHLPIVAAFLMGALGAPAANAQQYGAPGVMTVGDTTISLGGGAQYLSLPDMNFTFLSSTANGAVIHKQKNSDFQAYGGMFSGSIETPFGFWGGTRVTGVASGYFSNLNDGHRTNCTSTGSADCTVEDIIDTPGPDSVTGGAFGTKTSRDVNMWGGSAEARFGSLPEPTPYDAGGYLFHFGYVGIGTDFRGIDQDNHVRVNIANGQTDQVKYSETLNTTYSGGYLSVGGEYNILGYLGAGNWLGVRSFLTLHAGLYDASTDYDGRFTPDGFGTTRLGLSDDHLAFIGGATFETRKQFSPRTSLSLVTDYEWYSFAPEMKYVDSDVGGCGGGDCAGGVNRTHIADGDAFSVQTMLRFNIGLGPDALYPPR